MKKILSAAVSLGTASALAFSLIMAPVATAAAQDPTLAPMPASYQPLSADQLDNLVAPVALYADPLLAQVLLAATFPEQIQEAAQYVRANGTDGIDDQYWDVSVKAVAHYPTILNMMDQKIDWTSALGQAYAGQSSDVMQAVQYMRGLAQQEGNLQNTPQQQVVTNDGNISIWPAQPSVIYVPVYDPAVVFYRPMYLSAGFNSFFSFGIGYPIGAWLMYDWDWPARRIVYTGWRGGGWIARSRPYVRLTGVYVNPGYGHVRYGDGRGRDAGRYAVPVSHGVLVKGMGYREGQMAGADGRQRGLVTRAPAPGRVSVYTQPPNQGRTARRSDGYYQAPAVQPRSYRYAQPPMVRPRPYGGNSRPAVVQPRSYGGYSQRPMVQPRRAAHAPSAAPRGRPGPAPSGGGRTAHRGGHGH
ncbi:MAG: DUF3300 domain-containing protein [Gemmatimonadaceae bacterium]|nr:DUF3300 domain-containing protein [Gemmatimonadaceae bacterium]